MSRPQGGVSHWDEVSAERREVGAIRATWRDLGEAAGSTAIGVQRMEVDAGCRPGPVHMHGGEEEIFFVLEGSGLVWLDGAVHAIEPGDTIVCLAMGPEHTFIAGDGGLVVLAFGENVYPPLVRSSRTQAVWRASFEMPQLEPPGRIERDAAIPLELPAASPRPSCVVALEDVEGVEMGRAQFTGTDRDLGLAAGSVRTGLRHDVLPPSHVSCPPHHHTGEHELFVVLEGDGELLLHDERGEVTSRTALRAGRCGSRPAGTGEAHALQAGADGMTYLAYGTREPNEIVYYPRSRKAFIGRVLVRVEPVDDYWDGEL